MDATERRQRGRQHSTSPTCYSSMCISLQLEAVGDTIQTPIPKMSAEIQLSKSTVVGVLAPTEEYGSD